LKEGIVKEELEAVPGKETLQKEQGAGQQFEALRSLQKFVQQEYEERLATSTVSLPRFAKISHIAIVGRRHSHLQHGRTRVR